MKGEGEEGTQGIGKSSSSGDTREAGGTGSEGQQDCQADCLGKCMRRRKWESGGRVKLVRESAGGRQGDCETYGHGSKFLANPSEGHRYDIVLLNVLNDQHFRFSKPGSSKPLLCL
jgi:hypothetical protein